MAWIELHQNLPNHIKLKRVARDLGLAKRTSGLRVRLLVLLPLLQANRPQLSSVQIRLNAFAFLPPPIPSKVTQG